ncbi:MAG: HlyD family efflux transporter periplasmic adaptor subunit [Clostridium sp.]|nr:HlyD family efflux transporter periplasmic adaptor subunit [Clostridium sp.]
MNKYLEKRMKIRDKKLKYDFLPSMIEIIEKPSNALGGVILFLVVFLIVTALIWASVFKLDIAITALGTTMPETGVITLNSAYSGRISEIYVEDGSFVKEGDIILSLDSDEVSLKIAEYEYNLNVLNVQRDVYKEIYDYLIAVEEGEDIGEFDINCFDYGEYSSIAEAIVMEKEAYDAKIDTVAYSQREAARKEYVLSVLQNINSLDIKIYSAEISLEEAQKQLELYIVKAPTDGQVTGMSEFSKGSLINQGDAIGYILPEESQAIFTAYVADEDILRIKCGDTVAVKIAAYNNTKYEYMEGIVTYIGDISFNIEGLGTAYMVKIQMEDLPQDIKAGLDGSCDIIIGERSVLDYFLEPFQDGFKDSLKEV